MDSVVLVSLFRIGFYHPKHARDVLKILQSFKMKLAIKFMCEIHKKESQLTGQTETFFRMEDKIHCLKSNCICHILPCIGKSCMFEKISTCHQVKHIKVSKVYLLYILDIFPAGLAKVVKTVLPFCHHTFTLMHYLGDLHYLKERKKEQSATHVDMNRK